MSRAEDELICDLAETYRIYDFRELPAYQVALLVWGLRDDSRTKMKLSGSKISLEILLQSMMLDCLNFLVWAKTEDSKKNRNRPKLVTNFLLGKEETEVEGFTSSQKFIEMREKLMKGG